MKRISLIFLVFLIASILISNLPIQASPDTFGETSQGGNSNQNLENSIKGSVFTCPQAGTGISITVWLNVEDAAHDVKCRLYNTDGSIVTNGDTEEKNIGVGADQEITFNFNTAPTLAAQDYVIVAWSESITGACYIYSFSESDRLKQDNEVYDGWPDPATFLTYHQRCSIYCTYTPSAEEEEKSFTLSETINVLSSLELWEEKDFLSSNTGQPSSALNWGKEKWLLHSASSGITSTLSTLQVIIFYIDGTPQVQTIIKILKETAEITVQVFETVNPISTMQKIISTILAPITLEDVLGLAAIAFILAVAALTLVLIKKG